jgi:hypothetical protein
VSGSQLPSLQNAPDRKVQQIQVRRKRRHEPHLGVSKILGLKGKGAFIWPGGACGRRRGPCPLLRDRCGGPRGRRGPPPPKAPPPPKSVSQCADFRRFRRWRHPRRRRSPASAQTAAATPWKEPGQAPPHMRVPKPKTSSLDTARRAQLVRTHL